MDTTLVVMAAGIGSRFGGGIKQLAPVGPGGELIIDYSIYDAMKAGFNKVIFIIRKDIEQEFREVIGDRMSKVVDVQYAYQDLKDIPEGFTVPDGRKKPWGTGQAVLAVRGMVDGPFCVINADDFYGSEGFRVVHEYLTSKMDVKAGKLDMCMAGFILRNTLSDHGGVTRGVCTVDENDDLLDVTETFEISMEADGTMKAQNEHGDPVNVDADQIVSMNMWAFPPGFITKLEQGFPPFLNGLKEGDIKSEYLLPRIVDQCIKDGSGTVKVLLSHDKWFGVTYAQDKPLVIESVRKLIEEGKYPKTLY